MEANSSYANDGYTALTAAQRANFRDVLAIYQQAAGIVFVETTSGDAMVNVMNTSGSSWGGWASTAYSTVNYTGSGELVIDNSGTYAEGSFGFQTMLHELGHAMGLQHPWEGDVTLDPSLDDQLHTVMTYNNTSPYTDHLGTLDVAAMQAQYGAAAATVGWVLTMESGILHVTGSARGDTILGIDLSNRLSGADGADNLHGRQADDTLWGGAGSDALAGNAGGDKLYGGAGNDTLCGYETDAGWASGQDALYGGIGRDLLAGGSDQDALFGGKGRDVMDAREGNDLLRGDIGADSLLGGEGNDQLFGGTQNDTLNGGAGWDTLDGGAGNDVLYAGAAGAVVEYFTGGTGADRFVMLAADGASQVHLTDFTRGEDKIDLSDLGVSYADVTKSGSWLRVGALWIETTVTVQIDAGDFVF